MGFKTPEKGNRVISGHNHLVEGVRFNDGSLTDRER